MKKIIKLILLLFFLCFFISVNNAVLAVPGCCSWHGGEVGCRGGKTLCGDGTISSCPCDGTNSSSSLSGEYNKYNGVDNNSNDTFAILCSIIIVFSVLFVFGCIINLCEKNNINRQKKMREKETLRKAENEKLIKEQKENNVEYIIESENIDIQNYIDDMDEMMICRFTSDDLIKIIDSNNNNVFYIFDMIYKNSNGYTETKIFDNLCHKILKCKKINSFQNKCVKYIIDNRMIKDYEIAFLKALEQKHINLVKYMLNNCKDINFSFNRYEKDLFNNLLIINDLNLVEKISKQKNISIYITTDLLKKTTNINIENKYKFLSKLSKSQPDSYMNMNEFIYEDIKSAEDNDIIKTINNYSKMQNFLEENGYYIIYLLIKSQNINCIEYILNNYKNINLDKKINKHEKNFNGLTPLTYACYKKSSKIVEMLLDYGADGNYGDENGNTALEYACDLKNLKISKLLFERGYRLKKDDDNYSIERAIIKKESHFLPMLYISKLYDLKNK